MKEITKQRFSQVTTSTFQGLDLQKLNISHVVYFSLECRKKSHPEKMFLFSSLLQRQSCLYIDLPFTALLLSRYGFFGSAFTGLLMLSHLDLLPMPSAKHKQPALSQFFLWFTSAHCFTFKQLLRWVIITVFTGGVLFEFSLQLMWKVQSWSYILYIFPSSLSLSLDNVKNALSPSQK